MDKGSAVSNSPDGPSDDPKNFQKIKDVFMTPNTDVLETYKEWAGEFDELLNHVGYKTANIVAKELTNALDLKKESKILDVAAGTGLVGEKLKNLGFSNLDALDASEEMLNLAKPKNIYNNLYCVYVTDKPIDQLDENAYDGLITAGSFCENHLKPDCLPEFIRLVKPGGFVVLSIVEEYLTTVDTLKNFESTIQVLCGEGKWKLVERKRHPLFINNKPGVTFLLQVL